MPIRQTLSPHISTMHFLQKLFQELVHCDRTWRKKKGGGGKGQRTALHNQDVTLMFTMGKSNRQPGISRQPLPMFHQHIKTAHI